MIPDAIKIPVGTVKKIRDCLNPALLVERELTEMGWVVTALHVTPTGNPPIKDHPPVIVFDGKEYAPARG